MNLDELQSVQARERQSSDLQHLRSSFYREVGEYIDELTDRRSALVAEVDEPFSSPEVRQLSDDIETAEQTVEAIYERRVGKVVKKASIAAAGMPVDDDGLTAEEEALFEALVDRIERNRETVLSVLDGEPPSVPDEVGGSPTDGPEGREDVADAGATAGDTTPPADTGADDGETADPGNAGVDPDGVDAADLMGGDEGDGSAAGPGDRSGTEPGTSGAENAPTEVPPDAGPPGGPDADRNVDASSDTNQGGSSSDSGGDEAGSGSRDGDPGSTSGGDDGAPGSADATAGGEDRSPGSGDVPGIPRTTVRITADVGEVVGADNRDYDLGPEDVVTLPEANADVLVEKDAAERLE